MSFTSTIKMSGDVTLEMAIPEVPELLSLLNVSRQCLASGDEDVAVIAFEIFDELIEPPAPLLGESVRSIVQFSWEVCSSSNLEPSTRHQFRKTALKLFIINKEKIFWK